MSWVRLKGREVPSFHITVSGVLPPLCVLPLHSLHRCTLATQRSLSAGGLSTSTFWAASDSWWLLVALMCCHMTVNEFCSAECVLVLELRLKSNLVQVGSRLCGGPVAMTTSMELLEREKIGAPSSSSSSPTVPASLEKETD